MAQELTPALLESALTKATGKDAKIDARNSVGGGSINDSSLIDLADGRRYFVKTKAGAPPQLFECEAQGLTTLAAVDVLRVPQVVTVGEEHDGPAFLVLEAIEAGRKDDAFFERFGRQLAELHRRATAERHGFARDNFIGSTQQSNRWTADGSEFWRRHRLGFQLDLARRQGLSDPVLDRLGEKLLDRLGEFLGSTKESPSLLHGDLWSGNYMADREGAAVLIDPAVYYGHREADLAMTYLFGGFDDAFYSAYQEAWPLEPGSGERIEIYKLYHLLNHLNLFGGSYRASCIEILRRFA